MTRTITTALAGLALAVTGCSAASTAPASHAPASTAPASTTPTGTAPANPVRLIRQAGATPTPGERYGTTTAYGWLSADGTFSGGERITLYTLPAGLDGAQAAAQVGAASSDSQTVIAGPGFYAFAYPGDNGTYPVPAATIAANLHGAVLAPPDA